ncbi:MAG: hypothetical protein IKY67_06730 [Paludibacteraceae bacterium]|nr:hypothetical protein [Paludibacteraceae bacterium]
METKEQIIAEIEMRLTHARTLETQLERKWEEDVTNEDNYTQLMMWHATRVSLENLLRAIK